MKQISKIVCAALFLFITWGCRKEIKEPPTNTRNDNFVYIEIDGEKFMVEDRSWNYNKNTQGSFKSNPVKVVFENDTSIYMSFNCENRSVSNGTKKFKTLGVGLFCYLTKKLGDTYCNRIVLNGSCITEKENKSYSYSIQNDKININTSYTNNSFKNSKFYISKYDENEKTIEFNISGKVENEKDSYKLVPFLMKVKLKNNFKL